MLTGILDNRDDLRVAVVVNDVASVNIDARLIAPGAFAPGESRALGDALVEPSDVVRLQNGCACCAASEELLEGEASAIGEV